LVKTILQGGPIQRGQVSWAVQDEIARFFTPYLRTEREAKVEAARLAAQSAENNSHAGA
jgi:hypothetical protein